MLQDDLSSRTRALILVPTRELCDQARDMFTTLLAYCYNRVTVLNLASDTPVASLKLLLLITLFNNG